MDDAPVHRRFVDAPEGFRWTETDVHPYKTDDAGHAAVCRQVLFEEGLPVQGRYFEIGPDGHSSFEKHRHVHAVFILRGRGQAVVGERVLTLAPFDVVRVPPDTWHQFIAAPDQPLGFLCVVERERDRPVYPSPEERIALRRIPVLAAVARFTSPESSV